MFETNTYYVAGYRISARSYGQAIAAAAQLKRGSYPFNWPGESEVPKRLEPTEVANESAVA
jgi:hypothetical protein